MSKIVTLAAGAAGYVLGAKAGRGRYDQIAANAQRFWSNPRVQKTANDAKEKAREKAPEMSAKVDDVVSSGSESGSGSANGSPSQL